MVAYWIDTKYLGILSSQLPLYTPKSSNPFRAACRCPYCGDSKKNPYKRRGNFYQHNDAILFKCFNCGINKSVSSMLKDFNPDLKKEYDLETFSNSGISNTASVEKKPVKLKLVDTDSVKKLKKISQLQVGHPMKVYVETRMIPYKEHFRLYYAPKFFEWTNSIIPDKFNLENGDEPRLVIPFFTETGDMFGFQGRTLDPTNDLRYITIMIDKSQTKVYGLDQWDKSKFTYLVEGPIDSLFLPNCLAMAGSDVPMSMFDKDKTVVIYDNEPRNKENVDKLGKIIQNGYHVCIWPDGLESKDINDMVLNNLDPKQIIDTNIYHGLQAQLRFNVWKKV